MFKGDGNAGNAGSAGNTGIAGVAGIGSVGGFRIGSVGGFRIVGLVGVYVSVWVDAHVVGAVWAAGGYGECAPVVFGDVGGYVHGLLTCALPWW